MNNKFMDEAFNNYFYGAGATKPQNNPVINEEAPEKSSRPRLTANGNIDCLDELGEVLRILLNTAWGSGWGTISSETSRGDDVEAITTPFIRYSMNLREVSEGTSPKPHLYDTVNEVVDGKNTGDAFRIYRQSFDCIVEFDFMAGTSKSTRQLMGDFEELILTYTGFLKERGISEIFFLKEVPCEYSLAYAEGIPMKSLYYFVRFERIKQVRLSTIQQVEQRLALSKNPDQNSGEKNKSITYKL